MDAARGGRLALAALACAATVTIAATAHAATLSVPRACYAEGDRIDLAGSGFTPLVHTRLTLARADALAGAPPLRISEDPVADAAGRVNGAYAVEERTGWPADGEERFRMRLTLTDLLTPRIAASTEVWFSRWTVSVATSGSGRLAPRRPAALRAAGFTGDAGRPLFAHYTREGGARVRTVRLGTLEGACGTLTARLERGFPFRPVPAGTWHVAFNTSPDDPRAEGTIMQRAARVRRPIP